MLIIVDKLPDSAILGAYQANKLINSLLNRKYQHDKLTII